MKGTDRKSLDEMQSHVARLNDDYTALSRDVGRMAGKVDSLSTRVDSLDVNVAKVQTDVQWLKTWLPPVVFFASVVAAVAVYLFR